MRRPLIAGNWKLNLGPAAASALAHFVRDQRPGRDDVDIAVFPTCLSIAAVVTALEGSTIDVGIQEVVPQASGAHTGTNSAVMAREAGCTWMLTGHSERRQRYGETNAGVHDKVIAGLAAGLLPMICVGETLSEREAGNVDAVVHGQIAAALKGLHADQVATCTLAYEPVWAIGTGVTASPAQAQDVHASIRAWLATHYPAFVSDGMRILYGGSVKPANAAELLGQQDIDGALVGGAALQAGSFCDIIAAAPQPLL